MRPPVVTKDPTAVEVEVQSAYREMFPQGDASFVPRVFNWTIDCFSGKWSNYQAVDVPYHDLEHTLQGTLCMARLLRGRYRAGVEPALPQRTFELGIIAILLHDTGYLKQRDDTQGTGAKYTMTHVGRSASFAGELLAKKGFAASEIKTVQNMIHCTGLDASMEQISFQSEPEKVVGCALGAADLLGQMAAEDYVDKLPLLYSEFAEAVKFSRNDAHFIAMFNSAEDLVQKTPGFWEKTVQEKLNSDFGGVHRFLNDPYPHGPNEYLQRIESNMDRLRRQNSAARV